MPYTVDDLRFYLSGGAGNTNPNASLGGDVSNTRISAQTVAAPTTTTGVSVFYAMNNPQGFGLLTWTPSTSTLTWRPPNSLNTYGLVGVVADGNYMLGGGDGTLVVTVVVASLPAIYTQDTLAVVNAYQNVFDSVAPIDSLLGKTEYRCVYIKNSHGTITATGVRCWVKTQPQNDIFSIGLDPAGIGVSAQSVVAETTAPIGVTFSAPTSYGVGLNIGTLAPGQAIGVWYKRVTPEGSIGDILLNSAVVSAAVSI